MTTLTTPHNAHSRFTSNFTSAKDLRLALDLGAVINLDDISVLDTLIQVCTPPSPESSAASQQHMQQPHRRFPTLISFRLNPGVGKTEAGGTPSNVLGGPESKFGMAVETVVEAYRRAHIAGATEFGIHMMVCLIASCVCACVRACVHVCMWACTCVRARAPRIASAACRARAYCSSRHSSSSCCCIEWFVFHMVCSSACCKS
jgi:diaminopimelate decarboxylase